MVDRVRDIPADCEVHHSCHMAVRKGDIISEMYHTSYLMVGYSIPNDCDIHHTPHMADRVGNIALHLPYGCQGGRYNSG